MKDLSVLVNVGPSTKRDSLDGGQLGFVNEITGKLKGTQVGCANASEKLLGAQIGLGNYSWDATGIQAAAYLNIATTIRGVQLSPLNIATKAKGAQLGLVNIVTEKLEGRLQGVQVGVVCYANKGAYLQLGLLTVRGCGPWYTRLTPLIGIRGIGIHSKSE